MLKVSIKYLSFLIVLLATAKANADVKLPSLFTNHMVLQRDAMVPIWGWAAPGEKVTVNFAGQTKGTVTPQTGKWMIKLNPLKTGLPQTLSITGNNKIIITDVLVGEVWICSGQSNMEYSLIHVIGGPEASAQSDNPNLRIFNVPHNGQDQPVDDVSASWVYSSPKSTLNISAVGYWFCSKLQKELGVPVGFINASYGGTTIEGWISRPVLESIPGRDRFTFIDSMKADYALRVEKARPIVEQYNLAKAEAKANKLPNPPLPSGYVTGIETRNPSMLFNGEIYPLIPYAVKGIAWYQGESNAYVGRANSYKVLLPVLINQWRTDWGLNQLPFLIFQIAPNRKHQKDPNEKSGIAVTQEAQLKTTQQVAHTALVITMDVADTDVHYKNKEPIGERAMKAALAIAYNRNVEYAGPIFKQMSIKGNKATIEFTHISSGLMAKGDTLKGFVIAGKDQRFYFAQAQIKGNTVIVSSADVPNPVSVRYGWADYPDVNLFNKEGLPASPFRTDDWAIK